VWNVPARQPSSTLPESHMPTPLLLIAHSASRRYRGTAPPTQRLQQWDPRAMPAEPIPSCSGRECTGRDLLWDAPVDQVGSGLGTWRWLSPRASPPRPPL
jgi:hypothetical protein